MPNSIQNPLVSQVPSVATELSSLQGSSYDLNLLKYPQEVGGPDVPSYITFNIYVPTSSSYQAQSAPSQASIQSESQQNSDYLQSTAGKPQKLGGAGGVGTAATVGLLSFAGNAGDGIGTALGEGVGQAALAGAVAAGTNSLVSLRPALRRIAQSVSIYMPDTVTMQMSHDYKTASATDAMGILGKASAFGATLSSAFDMSSMSKMNGSVGDVIGVWDNIKGIVNQIPAASRKLAHSSVGIDALGTLAQGTGLVGGDFTALALRSAGAAVNPQVEMMYTGTQNRTFQFTFRFQPRSQQESQIIQAIIQVFKYFSSPAVQPHTYGRYFIVPGQFDITFKFGQAVNPFISKISTCVCTNVMVNYNPSDHWATMVDGAPPEIELQLQFTESDIIYQQLMAAPDGANAGRGF